MCEIKRRLSVLGIIVFEHVLRGLLEIAMSDSVELSVKRRCFGFNEMELDWYRRTICGWAIVHTFDNGDRWRSGVVEKFVSYNVTHNFMCCIRLYHFHVLIWMFLQGVMEHSSVNCIRQIKEILTSCNLCGMLSQILKASAFAVVMFFSGHFGTDIWPLIALQCILRFALAGRPSSGRRVGTRDWRWREGQRVEWNTPGEISHHVSIGQVVNSRSKCALEVLVWNTLRLIGDNPSIFWMNICLKC